MKLHIYVIIILILGITLPIQVVSAGGTHANAESGFMDYNFSNPATGTFPSNGSGFSFLIRNESNNYRVTTEKTIFGKGLNIYSKPLDGVVNWTTFEIKFPLSPNMTLRLTFNWNYNSNYYSTMSNIFLNFGGNTILRQYFGPGYGSSDYLNASGTTKIGADPQMNRNLTIQITLDNARTLFYSFGNGSDPASPVQFPINIVKGIQTSNGSLIIGGPFCNITLFNISLKNLSSVMQLSKTEGLGWRESNLTGSYSINSSDHFFSYDPVIDSLIFENSANNSIYALNLQNHTTWKIMVTGSTQRITNTIGYDGFYYYLVSNVTDSKVIRIDESDLSWEYIGSVIPASNLTPVYVKGNSEMLLYGSGKAFLLNLSTGKDSCIRVQGSNITGEYVNGSQLSFSVLNETEGTVIQYGVNLSDSTFEKIEQRNVSFFPSDISIQSVNGSHLSYFIWKSSPVEGNFVSSMSSEIWYTNLSIVPVLSTNKGLVAKSSGNYIFMDGSGLSSIPISDGSRILAAYNSSIICFNSGRIYIVYTGLYPIPDTNISVEYHLRNYYSGTSADLNFSVISNSSYTDKAFINGIPALIVNDSVVIHPDQLMNGTNNVSIFARNIMGSEINSSAEFLVDDFQPVIVLEQNSTSFSEGSKIGIKLANIPLNDIEALYLDGFILNPVNGSYFTESPLNVTGNYSMHFRILDIYGRSYNISRNIFIMPFTQIGNITIRNGSYVSSNNVSFSWKPVRNVSDYEVEAVSNQSRKNVTVIEDNATLVLQNGEWRILVFGIFPYGQKVQIGYSVIHILTYPPSLHVRMSRDYVSFSSDSAGANPTINITANLTSEINIFVFSPDGREIIDSNDSGSLNFTFALENYKDRLTTDGEYRAVITATGLSGMSNLSQICFRVNNSLPSFSWLSSIYYTNSSIFNISFPSSPMESLQIHRANGSGRSSFNGRSFLFSGNFSASRFTITEENRYGSINTTSIEIVYSRVDPEINLSAPVSDGQGKIIVNYTVSDQVNSTVYLYLNDKIEGSYGKRNGSIVLSFSRDGKYNIYATVKDICGNSNRSETIDFTISSIPFLSNVILNARQVLGFAWISPKLEGNDTSSFSYGIYLNSRYIGSDGSTFTILMPGYSTISVHVFNRTGDPVYSRRVFSTGPIPEIAVAIFILTVALRRNLRGSKSEKEILEYIRRNGNADLRSLIRNAPGSGVSRTEVKRLIKRNPGKLLTRYLDPDGNFYISIQPSVESFEKDSDNIGSQK